MSLGGRGKWCCRTGEKGVGEQSKMGVLERGRKWSGRAAKNAIGGQVQMPLRAGENGVRGRAKIDLKRSRKCY